MTDHITDHVIIVDDDVTNLNMAGHILSKNKMHVTALKSGKALLAHMKEHKADKYLMYPSQLYGTDVSASLA